MTELHGVRALTSGESLEAQLIFRDFGEGDKGLHRGALVGERAVPVDAGAAGREGLYAASDRTPAHKGHFLTRESQEQLRGTSVPAGRAVNSMAERALVTGFHRR